MTVVPTGFISVFTKKMKAITAVLVLGLLCGAEARWESRWHFGRNLLQVTPSETQPTAATIPLAAPNAAAVPPQTAQTAPATGTAAPGTVPGAVAAQPAAAAAVPAATTVPDTAAPGAVAAQPAAGTAATAPTATAPVTTAPAATAPVATAQPAADTTTDPAASPTLAAYPGRQGVYVIADPAPPPRAPAAPAAGTNATAAAADAGPPALAAGNNLIVVFTVMGEDAKTIYKNQQELRSQLATAAGVTPSQVLFYNQTANQDPRTGVTALSLSMAVDCGSPAVCARAGAALQNTTSQTKLSDGLAREGVSVMAGTFQVYGVNSFGRYKGNDTLYEDKNLFAPKPAAGLSYNETMARFGNASGAGGALPGTLPGMPLGNFSIPGFGTDNTTATAGGMQNGFNLSTFQIPQGLLPAGATPLGNATQQQPVAPLVRSSASGIVAGVVPVLLAAAAAMLM